MRSTFNPTKILAFAVVIVILFDFGDLQKSKSALDIGGIWAPSGPFFKIKPPTRRNSGNPFWPCTPCGDMCDLPPVEHCVWGETRDACNRRVCAKGPGERCGGPLKLLGECGEGMMCNERDERCHGCSIQTLQCHP